MGKLKAEKKHWNLLWVAQIRGQTELYDINYFMKHSQELWHQYFWDLSKAGAPSDPQS